MSKVHVVEGKKHSPGEETYRVVPPARVQGDGRGVVSQAGGVLLVEAARRVGLDSALSAALAPWRKARAVHDPGTILLDLALATAMGCDCLADVGVLRADRSELWSGLPGQRQRRPSWALLS